MLKRWHAAVRVLLISVFFLISCAPLDVLESPGEIVVSPNDQREYRYLTLDNKLRVLLVSDRDAEKSVASLDINIGSRQDPESAQGLAHFLEHMLFLGTEKYPEAGDYQAFISAHGGSHNAYTSFEHTNYFFDISPEFFSRGLDRFSQFFVAPLFDEQYVEREKNAVHSEYTAKLKDENRRGVDVFKQVINPAHPFSKLSVGNLETLSSQGASGQSLRDQLITFYEEYYSANLMTLVLVGQESLDKLEQLATEKFSNIKNSDKQLSTISAPLFESGQLPLLVTVKPEKSLRMLSLVFPTEDDAEFFRQKPLNYLGNILGHEGRGSLFSFLKEQGWAEGLSAGQGLAYQGGATFNISIQLTKAGVEHYTKVCQAVFQAIRRLQDEGPQAWLFAEQKAVAAQHFQFQEKQSSVRYAMRLASDMHRYPPQDLLRGSYLMTSFDTQLVERYLSYLNPANSLVSLTAPEVETDKVTHFYHVPYYVASSHSDIQAQWQQVAINPSITLPQPNIFIAEDLSLQDKHAASVEPKLLINKAGLQLWFQQDATFNTPKGIVYLNLKSSKSLDTPEQTASLGMLTDLLQDELNEFSYAAGLAGLHYSIYSHRRGISIKLSGFNDKQDKLLEHVLSVVKSPLLRSDRFDNLRREKVRQLKNRRKLQPYQLAMDAVPNLLYHQSWTDEELLQAYEEMTIEQVKRYQSVFFAAGHIDMLVYGNYHKLQAKQFAMLVDGHLFAKSGDVPPIYISQLPQQQFLASLPSDYRDSSFALYLQASGMSKTRRAAMGVSAQMMRADFYTQLRTEQQLGYIVSSGAYPLQDVPGLFFLVQSPVAGPQQLLAATNRFLQQRAEQLSSVTEADFNQQRDAVLSRLAEAPQSLSEQGDRYWKNIAHGYENFDFRRQLIDAMKALTFQQWQDYFKEDVIDNQRRLVIFSTGQFKDSASLPGQLLEDISALQRGQDSYRFP